MSREAADPGTGKAHTRADNREAIYRERRPTDADYAAGKLGYRPKSHGREDNSPSYDIQPHLDIIVM